MSTIVKLRGVGKVTAALRNLVSQTEAADVVAKRILDVIAREAKCLQKARDAIEGAIPRVERTLEVVATSYTGDLPEDGDWGEVMSRIEDSDQLRDLADLQEAMEVIVREHSDLDIQGLVSDLEDLELPTTATYDDE